MKKLILIYMLFLNYNVFAADVKVSWNANSENDIAGYIIYFGTDSTLANRIDCGNVTELKISNLSTGITYYFGVKAYDTTKNISELSEIVSHQSKFINKVTGISVENIKSLK